MWTRHTQLLVGILSWIIGWKSIQWNLLAVPVALSAMINNEARKHERRVDDHPDLSCALRGDPLGPESSRTLNIPSEQFSIKHIHLNLK